MPLSLTEDIDRSTYHALQKWETVSKRPAEINKRISRERLINLPTGQDVDIIADVKGILHMTLDTKLTLPSASLSAVNDVITYNSFITDVPGDGDCGYHAIRRASIVYGKTTANERPYPRTAWETRQTLLDFLREERVNIETAAIDYVNITQNDREAASIVRHLIWRDISCATVPADGTQPLFEEYCNSLSRSGLRGKWLGSMLGEIELHLLARCLGVKLFCVRASIKDERLLLRKEGDPFNFLWRGKMSCRPKGAIVIRFVGHFGHGHFQIVNCGVKKKEGTVKHREGNDKRKSEIKSPRIKQDVETVKSMHGVQAGTKRRYRANLRLVREAFEVLTDEGTDPLQLDSNGRAVLDAIMGLLMQRCGPKSEAYEGLSARSTGRALLASVGMWYKEQGHHFSNQETCVVKGNTVCGPPWKADQVIQFRSLLQKQQAKARSNPIKRAYQLTHDDVAEAMRVFVCDQLGEALNQSYLPGKNPKVDWLALQTTLMVVAAFGSGCRGAEMVNIRLGEIGFLSATVDTPIGAVLYGAKSKTGSRAVRRIVFPSWKETMIISPSHAVLMQLVMIHGLQLGTSENQSLSERPLFPRIVKNQPQVGQQMTSGSYSAAIKHLFKTLGISDKATEHSPRRGGCGFRYFVLNEGIPYIRDILGHVNTQETITYIGFNDQKNSYVSQGYSACNSRDLR